MNGRKRHILVDTEGLVLKVKVHEAGLSDKAGAKIVLGGLSGRFPRMRKVWADYAYRGLKGWMNHAGLGLGGCETQLVRQGMGGRRPGASESSEGVCGVAAALGSRAYIRMAGA